MNVLDLFSGIGGFSLGLERTGMTTVAFCEIDPYARAVLNKHWPQVPCYDDIRTLTAERLAADGIRVDVICGGFPCQDISLAGKGAGLAGERSGLWNEYARLIGQLRPRFVIVENVAALLGRGLAEVLGDLAALGFDAEWHCIPACAVGAPHRRDRLWIVAYPRGEQHKGDRDEIRREATAGLSQTNVADANFIAGNEGRASDTTQGEGRWNANRSSQRSDVADAIGFGYTRPRQSLNACDTAQDHEREAADAINASVECFWTVEPNVGRVANGVPKRVDRLRCLGNSIVPQIATILGRAILQTEASTGIAKTIGRALKQLTPDGQ